MIVAAVENLYFGAQRLFFWLGVYYATTILHRNFPLPLPERVLKVIGLKTRKQKSNEEKEKAAVDRLVKNDAVVAGAEAVALIRTIFKVFCDNELVPNGNAEFIVTLIKKSILESPLKLLRQLNLDSTQTTHQPSRSRSRTPSRGSAQVSSTKSPSPRPTAQAKSPSAKPTVALVCLGNFRQSRHALLQSLRLPYILQKGNK